MARQDRDYVHVTNIVMAFTELWYSPPIHTNERDLWRLITRVTRDYLGMSDSVDRACLEAEVFNHIKETGYWHENTLKESES